jgi:hypothetical protein
MVLQSRTPIILLNIKVDIAVPIMLYMIIIIIIIISNIDKVISAYY